MGIVSHLKFLSNNNNSTSDIDEPLSFMIIKATALFLLVGWTVFANGLVFAVLYKYPRLRTVPNLLVGNLAFSDFALGLAVLPFSAIYTITLNWNFGKVMCETWLSSDIMICTASIWNLSMIGLDRYWAITTPVAYMAKRNQKSAMIMIGTVWGLAAMVSIAPYLGWKSFSQEGNYRFNNITDSYQCLHFPDLPSFTIYSATGSFWIPLLVMFFVYYKIFRAFQIHKERQAYRQAVIKKHLESTILHDLSQVMPTSNSEDEDEDDISRSERSGRKSLSHSQSPMPSVNQSPKNSHTSSNSGRSKTDAIERSFTAERSTIAQAERSYVLQSSSLVNDDATSGDATYLHQCNKKNKFNSFRGMLNNDSKESLKVNNDDSNRRRSEPPHKKRPKKQNSESDVRRSNVKHKAVSRNTSNATAPSSYSHSQPHAVATKTTTSLRNAILMPVKKKRKKSKNHISAAREKRGVKVLGIILGCFTLCWFPFFIMYIIQSFCTECKINVHIEQFITWLGYANSATNPIIYTVFNRDYQNALKKLFSKSKHSKKNKKSQKV